MKNYVQEDSENGESLGCSDQWASGPSPHGNGIHRRIVIPSHVLTHATKKTIYTLYKIASAFPLPAISRHLLAFWRSEEFTQSLVIAILRQWSNKSGEA